MPPIISPQGLAKRFGVAPLFQNLGFLVADGERIGIIGPNGSGKSTLLDILSGRTQPNSGDVAIRKGTHLSLVRQVSDYAAGDSLDTSLAANPDARDRRSHKEIVAKRRRRYLARFSKTSFTMGSAENAFGQPA